MRTGWKLVFVAIAVAVIGVLVGFYSWSLTYAAGSPAYTVPVKSSTGIRSST